MTVATKSWALTAIGAQAAPKGGNSDGAAAAQMSRSLPAGFVTVIGLRADAFRLTGSEHCQGPSFARVCSPVPAAGCSLDEGGIELAACEN